MSSSRILNLIKNRKLNINNCNSLKRLTAIAYTLCQAQLIMEWSLKNIIEIVDESKDLTKNEQTKIALSMPIYACALYVAHMKQRHNISVAI